MGKKRKKEVMEVRILREKKGRGEGGEMMGKKRKGWKKRGRMEGEGVKKGRGR